MATAAWELGGTALAENERAPGGVWPADDLPTDRPPFGSGLASPAMVGAPAPVYVPSRSTPLDDDDPETLIPPAALWAMKYRRHLHLSFNRREDERLRVGLGEGDDAVYFIDDGANHYMVGRLVGSDEEGSTYCLVGRINAETYERRANAEIDAVGVFSRAADLCLCSVFVATGAVSNVLFVEGYGDVGEVPPEYLPPSPFIEFTEATSSDG